MTKGETGQRNVWRSGLTFFGGVEASGPAVRPVSQSTLAGRPGVLGRWTTAAASIHVSLAYDIYLNLGFSI